jgi:hypothetical protein
MQFNCSRIKILSESEDTGVLVSVELTPKQLILMQEALEKQIEKETFEWMDGMRIKYDQDKKSLEQ